MSSKPRTVRVRVKNPDYYAPDFSEFLKRNAITVFDDRPDSSSFYLYRFKYNDDVIYIRKDDCEIVPEYGERLVSHLRKWWPAYLIIYWIIGAVALIIYYYIKYGNLG